MYLLAQQEFQVLTQRDARVDFLSTQQVLLTLEFIGC